MSNIRYCLFLLGLVMMIGFGSAITPHCDFFTFCESSNGVDCPSQAVVFFIDSSMVDPSISTSWLWDFGDGANSTEKNPTHVYNSPGIYAVTLTVTNNDGSDTMTKFVEVNPFYGAVDDYFESLDGGCNGGFATRIGNVLNNDMRDRPSLIPIIIQWPQYGVAGVFGDGETFYGSNGYAGSDFFIYRLYDGYSYSNNATVYINVRREVYAPIESRFYIPKDTELPLYICGLGNIGYSIVFTRPVNNGTINFIGHPYESPFKYNPNPGFTGRDEFSYMCIYDSGMYGNCYSQESEALIYVGDPPYPLPGYTNSPTDPDGDGIYEDLNGNGRLDFADVVLYFNQMEWIAANEPVSKFDLNENGRIDFEDIVRLFGKI